MPPTTFTAADWYDLPRYYDLIFDADSAVEASFLVELHARFGAVRGVAADRRALEPACGSGRLVTALARHGWRTWGFDLNPHMLHFARQRAAPGAPAPVLWQDSMQSFCSPLPAASFSLAHCLVSTFKYLSDEAQARGCLGRVCRALAPGGIFALGLHLSDYDDRRSSRERWFAERKGTQVVCNISSSAACRRRRSEDMRARLLVRQGRRAAWRGCETTWRFRTYSAGQLRRLLASVPRLEHLATYGFAYDLEQPQALDGRRLDCVLVLRRRGGKRAQ